MRAKIKIYIFFGIAVLILAVMLFMVIPYLFAKIKASSASLSQKKEIYNNLETKQKNFYQLNREYQEIKPGLEKIRLSFVDEERLLDFIVSLENIAKQSGNEYDIKVIEHRTGHTKNKETKAINFQVSLKGSYPSLIKFMAYLEALPYLTKVSALQAQRINFEKRAEEVSSVNANVVIETYLVNDY